ncbi:hybrid sensor histidine kinase/response regulator [Rhizobium sp. TRM95796]|uniref:hybrid sensor histidine kinase/response regulator n=1 Tax=Rhizobium sp. TRM95796 TaxID=2979862 RepID=UPI0021E7678B|nr:hybrid sensor histidine kinase/response regulator [Rhizobium sp. TRM95796]MCV3767193.1 hybrid sensor histidine kinase/response regulator [Rhizobium sp. TRM95796]
MTTVVKFLLVDDLAENLLSLEALLRRDDLMLLKARSGDEALELLLQHDVALALIDVQMPGLNGFELAELMRGNERTRRVPIIFVTAGSHSAERQFQGYEAGAVDFIQKPIEPDILRSKADIFAELYRQRQMIAEQRDTLEEQARALQLADKRKNEFIGVLVHELRNPLAALNSGMKLLFRRPDPERAEQINSLMQDQMDHIIRLVDDLLDISRITQGKITLAKTEFDLKDAVSTALDMTLQMIEEKQHVLHYSTPEQPCMVFADKVRLTQCVSNLLNNAAKYTPKGGRIDVSLEIAEETYRIRVVDNGLGLTPEAASAIFQMFEQVNEHRDHSHGGLGIGLALVKQLMELHGGDVAVWSDGPGRGSIFTLDLPRTAPHAGEGYV